MKDLSTFILAGGQSTRMGADKAFLELNGRTLLAHALELGFSVTSEVFIAGESARFSAYARAVADIYPNCGPLGAIHAALRHTATEWNLMLAVDLPCVGSNFLSYLIRVAQGSGAVVTVPKSKYGWQPLCAIYRRSFVAVAEKALQEGRNKVDALFAEIEVQLINEAELERAGFREEMFRNLNTPEDLRLMQREARSRGITELL